METKTIDPGSPLWPAAVLPTPQVPNGGVQPGHLSIQPEAQRAAFAGESGLLTLEPADEINPYEAARQILDRAIGTASGDPRLGEIVDAVRRENPSKNEHQIAKFSQAFLIASYLQATRAEHVDNAHEGQETYMPQLWAVLEASVLARMQAADAGAAPLLANIPVASKAEATARELDVNFARDLAFKLRAYAVDDAVSVAIDKGEPRANVMEDLVESIVGGVAIAPSNEGLNMKEEHRAFALAFCSAMYEALMEGTDFSDRVGKYLVAFPLVSRDYAQAACAIGTARDVLAEMENG